MSDNKQELGTGEVEDMVDSELTWDGLKDVFLETREQLSSAMATVSALVSSQVCVIASNNELKFTIKGIFDTFGDISTGMSKILKEHIDEKEVFFSGTIEDYDDKLKYMYILNGYYNIRTIVNNVLSTSYIDMLSKILTNADHDMAKEVKFVKDTTVRTLHLPLTPDGKLAYITAPLFQTWHINSIKVELLRDGDAPVKGTGLFNMSITVGGDVDGKNDPDSVGNLVELATDVELKDDGVLQYSGATISDADVLTLGYKSNDKTEAIAEIKYHIGYTKGK